MLFWPSPVTAWVNQRRDPMSALLDDVSRIIASPISRRQTLRLVCGAVGGAVLASLSFGRPSRGLGSPDPGNAALVDRKSTRLNSSHLGISYAVFCLKKKKKNQQLQL